MASASLLAAGLTAPLTAYAQQPAAAAAARAPATGTAQPPPTFIPDSPPAPPAPVAPPATPQPAAPPATSDPAAPPATFVPDQLAPAGPAVVGQGAQPAATPKRRSAHAHAHANHRHKPAVPRAAHPDQALLDALPAVGATQVPSFFIDTFRIPPFLLPIYQAAGTQYGIRWEILAAINEIETDYGRNLNVSTAGAAGWMQFLPSTWEQYGIDANGDGRKDPYNPVDAIFAAARYLKAAGADKNLSGAIFAYNHAGWYVTSVLRRAQLLAALPSDLVAALTGLAQGRPPVLGHVRTVGRRSRSSRGRSLLLSTRARAPVVAVTDGEVVRIGHSRRLGTFVRLRDIFGNTYTYGGLARVSRRYPAFAAKRAVAAAQATPSDDAPPTGPATAGAQQRRQPVAAANAAGPPVPRASPVSPAPAQLQPPAPPASLGHAATSRDPAAVAAVAPIRPGGHRIVIGAGTSSGPAVAAAPTRSERPALAGTAPAPRSGTAPARRPQPSRTAAAPSAWPGTPLLARFHPAPAVLPATPAAVAAHVTSLPANQRLTTYDRRLLGVTAGSHIRYHRLRQGSRVVAGTILGGAPASSPGGAAPRVAFELRPAGRRAPRIDPRPIVAGWKLLRISEHTQVAEPSIGQVLLLTQRQLELQVLADRRVSIYPCGREDIRAGRIDRRVLETLELLAMSGLHPTVSALECGHSLLTSSGHISEHSSGNAVDIAAINGVPILGHQGPGSITETVIRRLLSLQGTIKPHQIISLMTFAGADNTLALPDHADHIHLGFAPQGPPNSLAAQRFDGVLAPRQWLRLVDRLSAISNPNVRPPPAGKTLKARSRHR